mmetsp:Transcript_62/g.253  ORF Transcript_62/g.253 Transcript_62/m.253 type:complete len:287 (+) Transcript_62:464-1324(+)
MSSRSFWISSRDRCLSAPPGPSFPRFLPRMMPPPPRPSAPPSAAASSCPASSISFCVSRMSLTILVWPVPALSFSMPGSTSLSPVSLTMTMPSSSSSSSGPSPSRITLRAASVSSPLGTVCSTLTTLLVTLGGWRRGVWGRAARGTPPAAPSVLGISDWKVLSGAVAPVGSKVGAGAGIAGGAAGGIEGRRTAASACGAAGIGGGGWTGAGGSGSGFFTGLGAVVSPPSTRATAALRSTLGSVAARARSCSRALVVSGSRPATTLLGRMSILVARAKETQSTAFWR